MCNSHSPIRDVNFSTRFTSETDISGVDDWFGVSLLQFQSTCREQTLHFVEPEV